jgi:phosphatidylglycerol---prolipoprotein diacylglyceryl transferase
MHPFLFHIGSFPIRAYGVMISLGILAGTGLAYYRATKAGKYQTEMTDFALYAVLGALIGGRVWEVLFTWDYYGQNLSEIPAVWHGGMSIQGCIVGGVLVAIWYTKKHKLNFWEFADIAAPGIILGQAIGRIGCLLNGDAYGMPAAQAPGLFKLFGIVYRPGTPAYEAFGATPLVPAESFEGMLDLVILLILLKVSKKKPFTGFVFLLYAALYSLSRFSLEFLRADSLRTIFNLKVAQLSSIIIILLSIVLGFYLKHRGNKVPHNNH